MQRWFWSLVGRDTKDFSRLGEGRDTETFAQSCEQRASGSVVLESLGLAGVQELLHTHTHTHRKDSLRTSLWLLHNLQLWSPFKSFTSCLCATCADTSCILTRSFFCGERDITCPQHLPLNQPPSAFAKPQSRLQTSRRIHGSNLCLPVLTVLIPMMHRCRSDPTRTTTSRPHSNE